MEMRKTINSKISEKLGNLNKIEIYFISLNQFLLYIL